MGDTRIFISHALSDKTQRDAQILNQLIDALHSAGIDVITDTNHHTDASFTQFLEQTLPTCQWFILFQTPEASSSERVQLAVDAALSLVERHSMQEIFRFIRSTSEKAAIPTAWNDMATFDATNDYQRAIEKVLVTFSPHNAPMAPPPPPERANLPQSIDYDRPVVPPSKLKNLSQSAHGTKTHGSFFQRKKLLSILVVLIVITILGTGLGSFLFLHTQANQSYGNVYFFNSGVTGPDNTTGICDGMQITLKNINTPAAGNSYYAWLLPEQNPSNGSTTLLGTQLGKLSPKNGTVNLTYVNPSHENLLLSNSRFLITEESATTIPNSPSPDQNTWLYYAAISQTINPKDANHYSELDYLRQLLAKDQAMQHDYSLNGGLTPWFYRNTRKLEAWASTTQLEGTSGDIPYVQQAIAYILVDLDGLPNYSTYTTVFTPQQQDLTPQQLDFNPQIPLLTLGSGTQNPSGYIDDLEQDMQGISASPAATASQRALAGQILATLNQVNTDLYQVYQDAKQLIVMSQPQLKSQATLPILEDLMIHANNAFVGRVNPTTGQRSGGVTWIQDTMPQLATFNVTLYSKSSTN